MQIQSWMYIIMARFHLPYWCILMQPEHPYNTWVYTSSFPDFIYFLEKLLTTSAKICINYCLHEASLAEGLHVVQNECDFNEFLEAANGNKRLDLYADYYHEPLFDWIQEEETNLEDDVVSFDDVDSILEYGDKGEHEDDDEVISLKRNFNDHFLNKLYPVENDSWLKKMRM
ncbi:unnamed protein product [Lactuca saligna]|uniref:Uncharacterized protein n=1 Tax=Lactuca saligna TaxID=75948 RepID=A0AA35ZBF5_LACSI|nr:unnamed protein product [Lactuca saligna]